VLLNALFAGSEMALVSLRDHQLTRLEEEGGRGRKVADLARDPNRYLSTIQVGITLAGFLASATAAVSLAEPLVEPLGFLGGAAETTAVVLVTLVLAYLTLVLGELVPKRIAMQRAEAWALRVVRPLTAMSTATRPVVWLLGRSTDLVVRIFGVDPDAEGADLSAEEARALLAEAPFTEKQRTLISEVIDVGDRTLREILVPRRDVLSVQADAAAPAALDLLVQAGRSRAPVVEDDLDRVVGVVHLRDLIHEDGPVRSVARPIEVFPESARVLDVLRALQAAHEMFALVADEHGGTEGIVTLEDLLEEVVGEVYDETDRDIQAVHREAGGGYGLPGAFPAHDLVDLGIEVEPGAFATVAGFILDRTGEVPEGPGVVVEEAGWRFEVLAVESRAITEVRATPLPVVVRDEAAPA